MLDIDVNCVEEFMLPQTGTGAAPIPNNASEFACLRLPEQIRQRLRAGIACVIQERQPEGTFQRARPREVIVEHVAL